MPSFSMIRPDGFYRPNRDVQEGCYFLVGISLGRSLTTSRSLLVNSFQFSEALNGNNHALLLRRYDDSLASRYLRTVWLSFNTARQADATDLQVGDAQDTFVGSDG
jgi:hypothetical protein